MVCVFPGFPEVLAMPFCWANILIKDDFPTLERPIKAYSGKWASGHLRQSATEVKNSIDLIITNDVFMF